MIRSRRSHALGIRAALLYAGLVVALAPPALAFEIPRRVMSCGATDVSGGSFQLAATVGEIGPVSAIVSGGSFRRGEGFWVGYGALAAVPGTALEIEITVEHRRKRAAATVVKKPFFDPPRKKS